MAVDCQPPTVDCQFDDGSLRELHLSPVEVPPLPTARSFPALKLAVTSSEATKTLLRLAGLEVRIPRLEILALERLADRDGKSVDAVLARELLDVVSANSEYLAHGDPGLQRRAAVAAGLTSA